jgi:hypothetical protein
MEKGYTSKEDNLTIRRWVIKAVQEKDAKSKAPTYQQPRQQERPLLNLQAFNNGKR